MYTYIAIAMTHIFAVSSSVINATAIINQLVISREFHSIIVTCTIHPDSKADECEVIAIGGNMNRTGICTCMQLLINIHN